MVVRKKRRPGKVGLPPGSLVYTGEKQVEKTRITVLDYDESHFEEKEIKDGRECVIYRDKPTVTWIHVEGLHEVEAIKRLNECFSLHPLVLEDILNTDQRVKREDYGEYIYLVVKAFYFQKGLQRITSEQVSLVIGSNFVLTFQEKSSGLFNTVVERLQSGKGNLRKMGADYLAYTLLDLLVDHYFEILEALEEEIEIIEEDLVTQPQMKILPEIHHLKRDMLILRKSTWPLREVISGLERGESSLFREATLLYLRDVYDHIIRVLETEETLREMLSSMVEIYLSSISNRLNAVMKVLTIIATIFMPLTFIAGVYGMNFKYMPELEWRWGYPLILLVMALSVVVMLIYFRRKKWI
jgi:magnesium transporter